MCSALNDGLHREMRDDFTQKTKDIMAHRAAYRCSKPDCGVLTRGAAADDDGTINVGFAAHIAAASADGPRYDPTQTSEQRKHHKNGVWLCGTHAKLIDSDTSHFTVEELYRWKRQAERRSFVEVVSSKPNQANARLIDDNDVQSTFELLKDYAKLDLSAFKGTSVWSEHAVELNLRLVDGENDNAFTISGLASGIEILDQVTVIAPPGTGKTTTLLQFVEATLANAASVAVFVPLSEWATRSETFFELLLRRAAFGDANQHQLELLAQHGKLVLIMDGWNELDERFRRLARNDIQALKRDFPEIRLVISSRHMDFDIPIDGPIVEIELLTEEQQLEIAKSIREADGEFLIDHAWRTPGLRDLVAIPLYLTALLKQAQGGSLPTTKEEILRFFVVELEQVQNKLGTLREVLQSFHRVYLEEISAEATQCETVTLSKAQSHAIVNKVQMRLQVENQIASSLSLQPMKILDTLVNAHMLIRSGTEAGTVSFQHQQFQEWFASFRVEQLMLLSVAGEDVANNTLRENILDRRVWEESILFSCDRLSRKDSGGVNAVAHAILEALEIDPMLSAEMIWRSSDSVWEKIKDDIMSFVGIWHSPGYVDRAVNFMNVTGRAEFSGYIWTLISHPDDQVYLCALRAGRRFRPTVLGLASDQQISALPDKARRDVLSEIASNSNSSRDGIELAAKLAKNDPNPEVKKAVIESLLFRSAERHAKEVLESAPDEVWRSIAQHWSSYKFADPEISARMRQEVEKLLPEATAPSEALNILVNTNTPAKNMGSVVQDLIGKIDFSEKPQEKSRLVERAYELYPEDVAIGLLPLLEQKRPVPYRSSEILRQSNIIIDTGSLITLFLQNLDKGISVLAGVVGPQTIGQLIDRMFSTCDRVRANSGKYDKTLSEQYHEIMSLISGTKLAPFMEAVQARAHTEEPDKISMLAELIFRHGKNGKPEPIKLEILTRANITAAVKLWAAILLASPVATREQFAYVAKAIERLASADLMPSLLQLLSEDLLRRARAVAESLQARKEGRSIENDAHMCWGNFYREAFISISDELTIDSLKVYLPAPEFGFEVAQIYKAIWRKSQSLEDDSRPFKPSPDFSEVPEMYTKRQSGVFKEIHPLATEIFDVINDLVKPSASDVDRNHALKLATVAFSMPYTNKGEIITALLSMPIATMESKRDFITTLVLAGEAIRSDIIIQGIDELLESAKENPWILRDGDGWQVKRWLTLLVFSEQPIAILEILDRLEGFLREPRNLHELLSAMKYAPSINTEAVLDELGKRDARFLNDHTWLVALVRRNTLSCARLLLDHICKIPITDKRVSLDHLHLRMPLSNLMVSHNQFRKELYQRFSILNEGPAKAILEYAIIEAADIEGIFLLIQEYAARNKGFQSTGLYWALRKVLVGETQIDSSGARELHSLPAAELRKSLFNLLMKGSAAESRLANECLSQIDEIRDDYGQVEFEVRHPDIKSGKPWPAIVAPKNRTPQDQYIDNSLNLQQEPFLLSAANANITKHIFDVSVTFSGEEREYVEAVVKGVEKLRGADTCFYDNNYKAQLARPSLDDLLQDIYQNRSKLIVVFLSESYKERNWCNTEFKAIREVIFERQIEKIMFVKMDDVQMNGVFKTDGYIDGRTHRPEQISEFIQQRLLHLHGF